EPQRGRHAREEPPHLPRRDRSAGGAPAFPGPRRPTVERSTGRHAAPDPADQNLPPPSAPAAPPAQSRRPPPPTPVAPPAPPGAPARPRGGADLPGGAGQPTARRQRAGSSSRARPPLGRAGVGAPVRPHLSPTVPSAVAARFHHHHHRVGATPPSRRPRHPGR